MMIDLQLAAFMKKAGNLHIRILYRKAILIVFLQVLELLLSAAVRELAHLGFRDIFLWVLEENLRARKFYEKEGFEFSGNYLDNNIGGKEVRELQYCCSVNKWEKKHGGQEDYNR